MLSRLRSWGLSALTLTLLFCVPCELLQAQEYIPNPQELDQLLAPIALYPDALLAQITTASTNPQEILDIENWLQQNPQLSGPALTDAAQAQGFDPPFIALVSFPQVLEMMARNIDDYAAIGAAFQANEASVMDSIQRLREIAYESGALRSNAEQQVVVEPYNGVEYITIQPANPQVVYIPQYDPYTLYNGDYSGVNVGALIGFGAGISLGILVGNSHPWGWGGWGWNWNNRRLLYNRNYWRPHYNHYRPPHPIYRPRPPNYGHRPPIRPYPGHRPVGGRPPGHRPPGNRPPGNRPPGNRPIGSRPPGHRPPGNTPPGNRPPGNRPPGNKPIGGQRPPGHRPPGNTPPGNRPPGNRPPGNKPIGGQRPPAGGARPRPQQRPQPRPQQRPTAQPRPQPRPQPQQGRPQQRPTAQPRPQPRPQPQQGRPQQRPAAQHRQQNARPAPKPQERQNQPQ